MKRPLVPYDGDMLTEIEGTFELNWRRCEELLPEDWALQLTMRPLEGLPTYIVLALLAEEGSQEAQVMFQCGASTPERALERMYYILREGLLAPVDIRDLEPGSP